MAILKQIREPFDSSSNWLMQHGANITSQRGEDGVIEKIFSMLGGLNHWCVEFGAWDGKHASNTYNLIANKNWQGVLIEADPDKYKELLQTFQGNAGAHCINAYVNISGESSLDNILASTGIPETFDLLSIDIDGNDYHIWDSLKNYRPKVVVIEFNPSIPNDIVFVQDQDFSMNHGCSLRALIELGKEKGYELVCAAPWNGFFVDRQYYELFNIPDNSINSMYDQQQYATKLFQLYDGTLVMAGVTTLMWHGVPITHEDIQPLPRALRKFPDKVKSAIK